MLQSSPTPLDIAHVIQQAVAPVFLLSRRSRLANLAITLCTVCALLICLLIVTLFVSALLDVSASRWIAGLFILAMLALIGGLLTFLQEIFVATATVRINRPQDRPIDMPSESQ